MTIRDILETKGGEIVSVAPSDTVAGALRVLAEHRIGAVLVLDGSGTPAGILSERDVVRRIAAQGAAILDGPVSDCMTADVVSCGPGESVEGAMAAMTKGRFRHLPVMEDGRLVGLVSIGDVVKKRIEEATRDTEELKRYIAG